MISIQWSDITHKPIIRWCYFSRTKKGLVFPSQKIFFFVAYGDFYHGSAVPPGADEAPFLYMCVETQLIILASSYAKNDGSKN